MTRGLSILNRRHFLAGAAGVATAASSGRLRATTPDDVIVIGAGLAGLHAAMILEDMGARVKVLEASHRPGGRVNTLYNVDARPDAGAQEVGPMYARTLSTINQLGLGLRDWMGGGISYALNVNGETLALSDWADSSANPLSGDDRALPPFALKSRYIPDNKNPLPDLEAWLEPEALAYDIPLTDHLRAEGASDEAIRLMTVGGQADDPGDESLLWHLRSQRVRIWSRGQGKLKQVVGGMSELPRAMVASLSGDVVYNAPVAAIDSDVTRARVTCTDGRTFDAKRVICTVPATVLRTIALTPGLPDRQAQAIETLPYGEATSVFLNIKEPFWEADGLGSSLWSDSNMRAFHWVNETSEYMWVFLSGPGNIPVRAMTDQECKDYVVEQLFKMRPAMAGRVEASGVWCWTQNPWSRGTYAYRSPGHIRSFGNVLADMHQRIHFAGEHTAVFQPGMEGAMESGERSALEVLERI